MKAPTIFQYKKHGAYLKKAALGEACTREAVMELVALGLVVSCPGRGLHLMILIPVPVDFYPNYKEENL